MLRTTTLTRRYHPVLILVPLLLIGLLTACGGTDKSGNSAATPAAAPTKITMTAKDYSFDMPQTVPAGLVDITMNNVGNEPHQANLGRLNQGMTHDQVLAAAQKDPMHILPLMTFVGGPNVVNGGQSQEVILNLSPGDYVATCFVLTKDHKATHVTKGMVMFFQVTGPDKSSQVSQPSAQGQVNLKDFQLVLPTPFKAGPVMLKVTNDGPSAHEFNVGKLLPGKKYQDVVDYFHDKRVPGSPPPFEYIGGIATLSSGLSGWVKLNLPPGDYIAFCFTPDPKTGRLHTAMDMETQFTAQ
jgi:hypothetical protein